MKRRILLVYQAFTGLSDACTGLMLIFAPALTLRLMHLHMPAEAAPFLSYIGTFVLSVGSACLYGGFLTTQESFVQKLEVVWLLTAITRGCVAVFVLSSILTGTLESGWMTVAMMDGLIALLQAVGLWRGWLAHVEK